jgi:hypothetical protein
MSKTKKQPSKTKKQPSKTKKKQPSKAKTEKSSKTEKPKLSEADKQQLMALWSTVGHKVIDSNAKAIALGGNFRFDLRSALVAIVKSAVVLAKLPAAAALTPMVLLGLAPSVAAALTACVATVRERMRASEFLICAVLSTATEGVSKETLKKDVRMFLKHDPRIFPWYLGIDSELFAEAAELHDDANFDLVVKALLKKGFLQEDQGLLHYQERNVSVKVV